jgi:Protein of unknown function (DUF2568)
VNALRSTNLLARFALELSALTAFAYWGLQTHWVVAVLAAALMGFVWALFLAPRRRIDLAKPARLVIEFVVFGAAALALAVADQPELAVVLAVVATLSGTLNYVWEEPSTIRPAP